MSTKIGSRKIGNVYKALTDDKHGLWLVALRDSSYGVLLQDPLGRDVCRTDFLGTYGVFDTAIKSKAWGLVGRVGFKHEDDEWPDATRLHELSDPEGKFVYYKGEIQEARSNVSSLNVAQIFKPDQFLNFMDQILRAKAPDIK